MRATLIEAGNLLEAEVRRETALGRQIKPYKVAGELVPSELVKQVLSGALTKVDGRFVIFDGFPRSVEQVDILFQLLKELELELCAALFLNVDFQTALNRITGRRICSQCGTVYNVYTEPPKSPGVCARCGGTLVQRDDDRIEVAQERFNIYQRETLPVIEFFRKKFGHLLSEESAAIPIEELANRIWQLLEKLIRA
jgi:adenylate kinase